MDNHSSRRTFLKGVLGLGLATEAAGAALSEKPETVIWGNPNVTFNDESYGSIKVNSWPKAHEFVDWRQVGL